MLVFACVRVASGNVVIFEVLKAESLPTASSMLRNTVGVPTSGDLLIVEVRLIR
jgi:hypothetical protein